MLLVGSLYENLPDWDFGLSIVMGCSTYLCAAYTISSIQTRYWFVGVALMWWCVDGSYVLYSELMNNPYVREANIYASTPLYLLYGIVLSYNKSMKEFVYEVKRAFYTRRDVLQ